MAAKVGRERTFDAALRQDDPPDHVEITLNVGAPKSIDRLFGVADDEDFTRLKLDRLPVGGVLTGLFSQVEENLVLNRIRVLKLIDEKRFEKVLELFAQRPVIAQEISRTFQ